MFGFEDCESRHCHCFAKVLLLFVLISVVQSWIILQLPLLICQVVWSNHERMRTSLRPTQSPQNIPADKLILAAQVHYHSSLSTIPLSRVKNSFQCVCLICLGNVDVVLMRNLIEMKILSEEWVCVLGAIAEDDCKVVGVVLLEDGVKEIFVLELRLEV